MVNEKNENLQESEEYYRSIIQQFNGIVYQAKLDSTLIFIKGAVEKITGYTENELISENPKWTKLIYPEDFDIVNNTEHSLCSIPDFAIEREFRIISKDGQLL